MLLSPIAPLLVCEVVIHMSFTRATRPSVRRSTGSADDESHPPCRRNAHSAPFRRPNGGDDIAPARLAQLDEQARAAGYHIMDDKAVKIAKANGPESIREGEREYGANWKTQGEDANGQKLEIELSSHDGKIVKIERD